MQNDRNEIYRTVKSSEKVLKPFQMIENEIDNDLLTKKSRKLAWIENFLPWQTMIEIYSDEIWKFKR